MDYSQRLVYNKLISGSFRVGVSRLLVTRALSQINDVPTDIIAQRLMGDWQPTAEFYEKVVSAEMDADDKPIARPFPFHLAHQIDFDLQDLGDISGWQAEWKWDGIRAQVIKREDQVFMWSRGEDLITERFPEIADAAVFLPNGTVLDGEILPWREDSVLPFTELQRRIGRKNVSAKLLAEVPVIVQVYELIRIKKTKISAELRQDINVPTNGFSISSRFDFVLNKNNTLSARYGFTRNKSDNQGVSDFSLPSRGFQNATTSQDIRLTETMVINPKTVNETRFGYTVSRRNTEGDNSIPSINVAGAFMGGGSSIGLNFSNSDRWELQNNTTTVLGKNNKHAVKFGVRIRSVSIEDRSEANFSGMFTFAGALQISN